MVYQIDHDLHIHSTLSPCCKVDTQTPERILQYARANQLHTVCLTDHFWDAAVPGVSKWYEPLTYERLCAAKPLPQDTNTRFLFGCETDMDADLNLGISPQKLSLFDFIVIATTHMHFPFTRKPEDDDSVEARANAWVRRFDRVLSMELPFHKIGIAHLSCRLIWREDNRYLQVLSAISDEEMIRLFTKAAQLGVGIELNAGDLLHLHCDPQTVLRPFRVAKQCGCKFYLGSDAHKPEDLDAAHKLFEEAISLLALTEADKFRLCDDKS